MSAGQIATVELLSWVVWFFAWIATSSVTFDALDAGGERQTAAVWVVVMWAIYLVIRLVLFALHLGVQP